MFSPIGITNSPAPPPIPTVADVQQMIDEAHGVAAPGDDLTQEGIVNAADVQGVVGAALGAGRVY